MNQERRQKEPSLLARAALVLLAVIVVCLLALAADHIANTNQASLPHSWPSKPLK